MKRFLVADDHVTVRLGVELLIKDLFGDVCTVQKVNNGQQVLQELQTASYDVLIMDMNMPEPAGFVLLKRALELQRGLNVLVISVNPETYFAPQVIITGALGYINKSAEDQELKKAIKLVTAGTMYLPRTTQNGNNKNVKDTTEQENIFMRLSEREKQVMILCLRGYGILEISNLLGISTSAAGTLKGRLFRKLKVETIFDLYKLARQHQLMNDETIQY